MAKENKETESKLRKKYHLVVYNNETYEEKANFKFTLLAFLNIVIFSSVLLIVLVTYLIAFTPLREYIPGYTDVSLNRRVYEMERRADSMELVFKQKDFTTMLPATTNMPLLFISAAFCLSPPV